MNATQIAEAHIEDSLASQYTARLDRLGFTPEEVIQIEGALAKCAERVEDFGTHRDYVGKDDEVDEEGAPLAWRVRVRA